MKQQDFANRLLATTLTHRRTIPQLAAITQISLERLDALLGGTWLGGQPPTQCELSRLASALGLTLRVVEDWVKDSA